MIAGTNFRRGTGSNVDYSTDTCLRIQGPAVCLLSCLPEWQDSDHGRTTLKVRH